MDINISKEETLEQLVNDQKEEIEQLKVARAQLQVAVRKLSEDKETGNEDEQTQTQG